MKKKPIEYGDNELGTIVVSNARVPKKDVPHDGPYLTPGLDLRSTIAAWQEHKTSPVPKDCLFGYVHGVRKHGGKLIWLIEPPKLVA